MRECVSFHVGQAGCQLGERCWKMFFAEHNIPMQAAQSSEDMNVRGNTDIIFNQVRHGFVPRCVFIDDESSILDGILSRELGSCFHCDRMVKCAQDASNNFARGKYTVSKSLHPLVEDPVRKMLEECNSLQCFMFYNSFGGGLGSGYTPILQEQLQDFHPKITKINIGIFPSIKLASAIVEPYNAVLHMKDVAPVSDMVVLFDNESVYQRCANNLNCGTANFSGINNIISHIPSFLISSLRFPSSQNMDVKEYATNLIPFPGLKYVKSSLAPLLGKDTKQYECLNTSSLVGACVSPYNQLFYHDKHETTISTCFMFKGNASHKEINQAMNEVRESKAMRFPSWMPTGIKIGVSQCPSMSLKDSELVMPKRSVCMLSNSTFPDVPFDSLLNKFNMMYEKRAFVHWYLSEHMEEAEFENAQSYLKETIGLYQRF